MRVKMWLVLINLLVWLGACGGSNASTNDSSAGSVPDSVVPSSIVLPTGNRLVDYLAMMGCTGYVRSDEVAPFATEWGTCTFRGGEMKAYLFPDAEARDAFFSSDNSLGLSQEQVGIDGPIVLAPSDPKYLQTLRNSMGR